MPDWRSLVKQRLGALGLDPWREAEIVEELAGHCQEAANECRRRWQAADEPAPCALDDICDWQELGREIRRAELEEDAMNQRTRRVWLPGLVTLTLSMGLFWSLESLGLHMRILWFNRTALVFSLPWLLGLPFVGGLGAYLCARGGGRISERLLAALFPSAAMTALFAAVFLVALIIDSRVPHTIQVSGLINAELGWAIFPGAALLIGSLPFLLVSKPRPTTA